MDGLWAAIAERLISAVGWVGSWLIPWAQSPGFGGLFAVIAALIAYAASRRMARVQRDAQRKEQWWKRAEWALNLTLDENPDTRSIGYNMLTAMSTSKEWAPEHELDVIAAATDRPTGTWLDEESAPVVTIGGAEDNGTDEGGADGRS